MKATLDRAYILDGMTYGPGEVDVPDDVTKHPALSEAFRAALEPTKAEAGAAEATGAVDVLVDDRQPARVVKRSKAAQTAEEADGE